MGSTAVPTAASRAPAASAPLRLRSVVSGKGPPFVLVGGGLTGFAGFEKHAESLGADRKIVQLQQIGVDYGLEDRALPPAYSMKTETSAMEAALDALQLTGPLDLMGHSSGGLVVLAFALDHPERVRSLVLSEPPAYFLLDAEQRARPDVVEWTTMLSSLPVKGEIGDHHVEAFVHGVGAVPKDKSARENPRWATWVTHRRSLRSVHAVVEYKEDPARLRAFERPTLLVRGLGTASVHVLFNELIEKSLPHAKHIDLRGGHAAIMVSRDQFLDEVRKFLAQPN